MQQLQHETDSQLARTLDKTQFKRLNEIQLQAEGPGAVIREDVAQKLEITDEQHEEIQGILREAGQARGQIMRKNFDYMRSLMPAPAGGNAPGQGPGQAPGQGPGAAADPNQNGGGQAQANAGGQGGRGNRGNRGNRGGNANGQGGPGGPGGQGQGRPRFDPAEMQKVMEKPEVKAKMEETRKEEQQLRDREYAMVFKAMDRRQVSTFKKMLGKPFDVDAMRAGFFRGMGRNGPNQNQGAQAKDASKTAPATSAGTDTASGNTTKPATSTPRRQSLRERRGLGSQQPSDPPGGN
jgi:hypothetical protein